MFDLIFPFSWLVLLWHGFTFPSTYEQVLAAYWAGVGAITAVLLLIALALRIDDRVKIFRTLDIWNRSHAMTGPVFAYFHHIFVVPRLQEALPEEPAYKTLLMLVANLVLFDFVFYWFHRLQHGILVVYENTHIQHHKSKPPALSAVDAFNLDPSDTLELFLPSLTALLLGIHPLSPAFWVSAVVVWSQGVLIHHPGYMPPPPFMSYVEHRRHHLTGRLRSKNLGFLTTIWDRRYGTHEASPPP